MSGIGWLWGRGLLEAWHVFGGFGSTCTGRWTCWHWGTVQDQGGLCTQVEGGGRGRGGSWLYVWGLGVAGEEGGWRAEIKVWHKLVPLAVVEPVQAGGPAKTWGTGAHHEDFTNRCVCGGGVYASPCAW